MTNKKKEMKIHPRIGRSKARELYIKYQAPMRVLTKGKQQKELRSLIQKGIVREFLGQYIPRDYNVAWGIVYDTAGKKHSSEIDGIVYRWPPVLDFADIVVTDKKRTKLVVMVKGNVKTNDLLGTPLKDKKGKPRKDKQGTPLRDSKTELLSMYNENRDFGKKYVLFIFSLEVSKKIPDSDIQHRLNELSDIWVVVWKKDKKGMSFDYGNSVSLFMERMKTLGR